MKIPAWTKTAGVWIGIGTSLILAGTAAAPFVYAVLGAVVVITGYQAIQKAGG